MTNQPIPFDQPLDKPPGNPNQTVDGIQVKVSDDEKKELDDVLGQITHPHDIGMLLASQPHLLGMAFGPPPEQNPKSNPIVPTGAPEEQEGIAGQMSDQFLDWIGGGLSKIADLGSWMWERSTTLQGKQLTPQQEAEGRVALMDALNFALDPKTFLSSKRAMVFQDEQRRAQNEENEKLLGMKLQQANAQNEAKALQKANEASQKEIEEIWKQHNHNLDKYGVTLKQRDSLMDSMRTGDEENIQRVKRSAINSMLKDLSGSAVSPTEYARFIGALAKPENVAEFNTAVNNLVNQNKISQADIKNAVKSPKAWPKLAIAAAAKFLNIEIGGSYDALIAQASDELTKKVEPERVLEAINNNIPTEVFSVKNRYNEIYGPRFGVDLNRSEREYEKYKREVP